jgi:hypothetical protein
MTKMTTWIPLLVLAAVIGGLVYYQKSRAPEPVAARVATPPPAPVAAKEEPAINYPVQAPTGEARKLPTLDASDADVVKALEGWLGKQALSLLATEGVIRRVVATIDNLPRKKVAVQLWPVKPMPGQLLVSGERLSDDNAARYAPLMQLLRKLDVKQLASFYFEYYSLFQQVYEGLGYPGRYFNDRLVVAIDDMLQAPELDAPIELTQPSVMYKYADPELEDLSAGQKIMLRVGKDNAALIRAKLTELRKEVTNQKNR